MMIFLNKTCSGKDRFLNEIKMDFEKICRYSGFVAKLGSVSKNADLRFMLYIKNNLWGIHQEI
jgi:hypothetical protein